MKSVSNMRRKQQSVIEFLVAAKQTVGKIHNHLCAMYGNYTINKSTVGCWVKSLKPSEGGEMELREW